VVAALTKLTATGAKLANLYSLSEAHDVALEPDLGAAMLAMASDDDDRRQGLTLAHFTAHRKRLLWDWGCIQGIFGGV
jgi:hypothetical protein